MMSSQSNRIGFNVNHVCVIYLLTLVLHRSLCEYICPSKVVKIPEISARKPQSAYRTGPVTEFRITKVYDDDINKLSNAAEIKTEFIEPGFRYWEKVLKPKIPTTGTLKVTRRCTTRSIYWIPEDGVNQKYCAEDCRPSVECADYTIPHRYVDGCRRSNGIKHDNLKDGGTGVTNTDLLVFISYRDYECGDSTLAYAVTCQRNAEMDRPEVAYINYCPKRVKFTKDQKAKINSTTIHELGHALGFGVDSYAYMRDAYGNPRTVRKDNAPNLGLLDDSYRASNDTITTYKKPWPTATGYYKKEVFVLKTENMMEAARKYFNCDKLVGVELEDNGGSGTAGSHLKQTIYKDEVMVGSIGKGYVSELTLAFMKDTGWYHVDMSAAEHLPWGYRKGCWFAKSNCYRYMKIQKSRNQSSSPWCGKVEKNCQDSGTMCGLRDLNLTLPADKIYFKSLPGVEKDRLDTYGGTESMMDYCPYEISC